MRSVLAAEEAGEAKRAAHEPLKVLEQRVNQLEAALKARASSRFLPLSDSGCRSAFHKSELFFCSTAGDEIPSDLQTHHHGEKANHEDVEATCIGTVHISRHNDRCSALHEFVGVGHSILHQDEENRKTLLELKL
jgi:hypothetical protein